MVYAKSAFCKAFPAPNLPAEEEEISRFLRATGTEVLSLITVGLRNCRPLKEATMPSLQLESFLEVMSEGEPGLITAGKYQDRLKDFSSSALESLKSCKFCGEDVTSQCYASWGSLWHPACLPCFHCNVDGIRTKTRGGYDHHDQPERFREVPIFCRLCGGHHIDSTIVFMPKSELLICRLYAELFKVTVSGEPN